MTWVLLAIGSRLNPINMRVSLLMEDLMKTYKESFRKVLSQLSVLVFQLLVRTLFDLLNFCEQGKSDIEISDVFAFDFPVDLARFYNSANENHPQLKADILEEAEYMPPFFERLF